MSSRDLTHAASGVRDGDRCACQAGRDFDGSEFGPCAHCESVADHDAAHRALLWDALRWRFTQSAGYGANLNYEFSEVESNVVVVYSGGAIVGVGGSLQAAIDCALHLIEEHGKAAAHKDVLSFWRQHFRSHWDGRAWVKPVAPAFDIDDEGRVSLRNARATGQ